MTWPRLPARFDSLLDKLDVVFLAVLAVALFLWHELRSGRE